MNSANSCSFKTSKDLFKRLETIALFAQPFERRGQGCSQFVDALQRVVEGDDGAVARVVFHIVDHIFGSKPFRVVARDEVPHHNLVFLP